MAKQTMKSYILRHVKTDTYVAGVKLGATLAQASINHGKSQVLRKIKYLGCKPKDFEIIKVNRYAIIQDNTLIASYKTHKQAVAHCIACSSIIDLKTNSTMAVCYSIN